MSKALNRAAHFKKMAVAKKVSRLARVAGMPKLAVAAKVSQKYHAAKVVTGRP